MAARRDRRMVGANQQDAGSKRQLAGAPWCQRQMVMFFSSAFAAICGGLTGLYGLLFVLMALTPDTRPEDALPYLLISGAIGAAGGAWLPFRIRQNRRHRGQQSSQT